MQAIVYDEFGPPAVLHLEDVERPEPGARDVLVRVRATSVNYGDLLARNLRSVTRATFNMPAPFLLLSRATLGFSRPRVRILGSEYSGVVQSTGPEVSAFKPGDEVFGYLGMAMGAYAEFVRVPERGAIARKPATMSFPEAAVTPYGAIMAVALLDRVGLAPGHRMLVIGASGSLGSAAVQIAKARGAHVTGIGSGRRENYVRAVGADAVLDYARDDFRGLGETWDVIFDVLGKSSFRACRSVLKPDGQYLRASFKTPQLIEMLWSALVGGKRAVCYLAPGGAEDLERVRTLAEDGLLRSIVDREFPLAEAAAAHQYVEEGRAEGKVALSIPPA